MLAVALPPLRDVLAQPFSSTFSCDLAPIQFSRCFNSSASAVALVQNQLVDNLTSPFGSITQQNLLDDVNQLVSSSMTFTYRDGKGYAVKTVRAPEVVMGTSALQNTEISARICTVDTVHFSDSALVSYAQATVTPPPRLASVICNDNSLVFPARLVQQHSQVYPKAEAELFRHIRPVLNPAISTSGIGHVVWALEYEHDDELRYARLPLDFSIPSSVSRLTIEVRRTSSSHPISRDVAYWLAPHSDGTTHPIPVNPAYVANVPSSGVVAPRDQLLAPDLQGVGSFFMQLAHAIADAPHPLKVKFIGADAWPGDWVNKGGGQIVPEKV